MVQDGLEEKTSQTIEKKFKREKLKAGISNPNKDILATEGGSTMKKLLVMKADKVDIERIYEIKSNKTDTDNMLEVQAMMQKQMKHTLVLFLELVNLQSVRADDTRGSYETRQQELMKQISSLANWVMRFDPMKFMKNAELVDRDMFSTAEKHLTDYTDKVMAEIPEAASKSGNFSQSLMRKVKRNRSMRQSFDSR